MPQCRVSTPLLGALTLTSAYQTQLLLIAMALTAEQFEAQMPDAQLLLSDEPEMESSLHYAQLLLLVSCLEWLWGDRTDFFIGANLTIYFSRQQLKNREYRGPDFFLVKNTDNRPRPSWVVWEEDGRYPNLIIELLSDSTAKQDRTLKKRLYQDRFRTTEYFWFSPDTLEFQGFHLVGPVYIEIPPDDRGWRWSEELGLFLGIADRKLRYFTPEGNLVPNFREAVDAERAQAEQAIAAERIQAEQAIAAERIQAEQAIAAERIQAEQAIAAERIQAEQAIAAERIQAEQAIAAERIQAEQAIAAERTQAEQAIAAERAKAARLAERLRALGIDPEAKV